MEDLEKIDDVQSTNNKSILKRFLCFVLIFSICILFTVCYIQYININSMKRDFEDIKSTYEQRYKDINNTISNIDTKIVKNKEQYVDINKLLTNLDTRIIKNNEQVELIKNTLSEKSKQNELSREDSLNLFEIFFVLKLANRQFSINKDYYTSVELLKDAEALLLKFPDIYVQQVREQISNDINDINNYSKIDKESVIFDLDSLKSNINKMVLKQKIETYQKNDVNLKIDTSYDKFIYALSSIFNKIFIIETKSNIDVITEQRQLFLEEELLSFLTVAKVSLINNNYKVFTLQLNQFKSNVEKYYNTDNFVVKNSLDTVNSLLELVKASEVNNKSYLESYRKIQKIMNEYDKGGIK
ncbi:MAG: uroporphyrinogen-III C-methyltransferase [Succinivibrionaceae bacterium]